MKQEAHLANGTAEALAHAGLKAHGDGERVRAEAIWFTCRKVRVNALLHHSRVAGAGAQASFSERP